MIRIAVVEDDELARAQLGGFLRRFTREKGVDFDVDFFDDGEKIVFSYEAVYDIIFMDIEMPGMDGMTAAKKIRAVDPKVILIFTTNMAQYAIEGYKVRARAYLLKPLNYTGFSFELDEAVRSLDIRKNDTLLISGEDGLVRVRIMDILYIEVQKHTVILHTKEESISFRGSMKDMEEKLAGQHFIKCDQNLLVNLAYVTGIRGDMAAVGGELLPISRRKRKDFIAALTDYVSASGPELAQNA